MTDVVSKNSWRLESPGEVGWLGTARPGQVGKYFMVSSDTHHTEPIDYLDAIEPQFRDRLPKLQIDDDGAQWLICEYGKPQLVKPGKRTKTPEVEAFERTDSGRHYGDKMDAEDKLRVKSALTVEQRLDDAVKDGVDAQLIFPNKGLLCWATPDPVFQMAMCRAYNRWSAGYFHGHMDVLLPMALLGGATVDEAIAEARWAKEQGFKGVALPAQPIFGIEHAAELFYNDKRYEPLWGALAELALPITFHVSTGRDPRATGGKGGAIINYCTGSMNTTMDPLINLIASGVFERYPLLAAGSIESGVGWVPWFLEAIDHAYRAHHMWVRPVIPEPPSHYYRRNCFSTFTEDHVGMRLVEELDLVDNFLWSNDYPHHEGTFPHSAEAIEREMGGLREETRVKLLGRNAARIFGIEVPADR